ncbi:MAG: rRNA maturation RNase YbeY [Gammaproteobacteria bacterium]|nr:rRNA maturation RNase YbeY [Gammaproteobacteria bacterium]
MWYATRSCRRSCRHTTVLTADRWVAELVVEVQRAAAGAPTTRKLGDWARAAWRGEGRAAEVVVRITGEAESRHLNRDYRGKDKPTNVLSFPSEPIPGFDNPHIGDLVVCAPVVAHEATAQGKSADAHWAHMIVHGMLHLQGYDHENDADALEMETLETHILTGLGFPAPYADDEAP